MTPAWSAPLNSTENPMKTVDELQVVNPNPQTHLPEMFDMCAKVFSRGMSYFGCYQWCKDAYIMNCHYDWNSSAIGIMDGKIVTHLGIWDYQMRVGAARLRVGGIGLVSTHADYRRRGLMDRTARASIDFMTRNGYDLSLLFGIAGYYDRFGFVPAWDSTEYTIERHHLPKDKPSRPVYKFAPKHRDDLAALHSRENATRTGTAVRPTFLRNQWPEKWFGYLWKDPRGKVAGYVVLSRQDDNLSVIDCVGDDKESLAVLALLVNRLHVKNLVFSGLHYDNPLRKRLMNQSYSWSTTRYRNSGGSMVCTINLMSSLAKLTREFSARLRHSCLADWRGSLLVSDARETFSLVIDRSRVKLAPPARSKHRLAAGPHLAQLLIGSYEPVDIIEAADMKLAGDAPCLVEVLFPFLHPSLDPWDHF